MVLIIDGRSKHCAHIWSKSGISIHRRHLLTSIVLSNPIFWSEMTHCASYVRNKFELPSYIRSTQARRKEVLIISNLIYVPTPTGCPIYQERSYRTWYSQSACAISLNKTNKSDRQASTHLQNQTIGETLASWEKQNIINSFI